ncbi:MAG: hypothetical protein ACPH12_07360 [Flavobacteriaceae bacterium]|jgi:hypothetical protein
MNKQLICPYSGEYFKPKRSNQKYASKYNRVAFHNRKYRELKMPLEKVNHILFKNHNIISDLIGDKNEIILSNDYLKGKEYNFKYMTHIIFKNDKTLFGVYNFLFTKVDESTTKFIRNETN